ncbi:hypothetical protein ACH9L7_09960 [Haloferax sp. S1W]|uniref:hypothetical protein n=1 Tax=Haloferax sp. S1W TaxID=3377110 RepID=UPI0037CC1907
MKYLSRRNFIATACVSGVTTLAGCSTFETFEEPFVKYKLDGIFTDNAVNEEIEFSIEVLDGTNPIYTTNVTLDALGDEDGESSKVIEEPWMEEEKARYGIRVIGEDGEKVSLTLPQILENRTREIHDTPYIEYSVTYTGFYRISVNFYDNKRS